MKRRPPTTCRSAHGLSAYLPESLLWSLRYHLLKFPASSSQHVLLLGKLQMAPLERLGKVMTIPTCQHGLFDLFYEQIGPTTVGGQIIRSSQRRGCRFLALPDPS